MLAKPQTFMNASGESVSILIPKQPSLLVVPSFFYLFRLTNRVIQVGQLVSYFKIPLNQVLVMYDDLDLPFAKLRLLPKGGHGGHNGVRSIINHLKQNRDFPRLRIGIALLSFFNSVTMSENILAVISCRHWTTTWEDGSCQFCSPTI
jgi:PTH1 family peptidyl-tRNA hydrolase